VSWTNNGTNTPDRSGTKDAPAIYARHLAPEDIRVVIAFYRTPAGTRLMQVVPAIIGEIFAVALPAMPTLIAETHDEFLQLARQRGYVK
jgi:hypothetical protein